MPVLLPVERVKQVCNPFQKAVWEQGPRLTRRAVADALINRRLASAPTSADHAARVAFFVENESTDPIDIDVGVPALGMTVATDGETLPELAEAVVDDMRETIARLRKWIVQLEPLVNLEPRH